MFTIQSIQFIQSVQSVQSPQSPQSIQPIQYSCYIDQQRRLRRENISQNVLWDFISQKNCEIFLVAGDCLFSLYSLQSPQSTKFLQSLQSPKSIHCIQSIQVNLAHLRVDFRAFFYCWSVEISTTTRAFNVVFFHKLGQTWHCFCQDCECLVDRSQKSCMEFKCKCK